MKVSRLVFAKLTAQLEHTYNCGMQQHVVLCQACYTSSCCRMAACLLAELLSWAFLLLGAKTGLLGPRAVGGFEPGAGAGGCCPWGWFSLVGLPAFSSANKLCVQRRDAHAESLWRWCGIC